jgi:hypothetical protein
LLAATGCLILGLSFAAVVSYSYRIDFQPQGRYLFAAFPPVALAIVGGWEHLAGSLRLRWLVAPLIIVLVLTINVIALVCALAPAHHSRYLGRLLELKGEIGESYSKNSRYLPRLPKLSEPGVHEVYGGSPARAIFAAQESEIERLEMVINIPSGARGPLIWRLTQQGIDRDLLVAVIKQPLAGLARYRIDVSSYQFTAGKTYQINLEAPAISAQRSILTTLSDIDVAGLLVPSDSKFQVVYPSNVHQQPGPLAGYFALSDSPTSTPGKAQRLLYPLDFVALLALVSAALAPLLMKRRIVVVVSITGLIFAFLLPVPRASGMFIKTYEIAATEPATASDLVSPAPAIYEGFHDTADCNLIRGWAWDVNQPNSPVNLDIYDGDELIDTISANVFRPDLLASGIGNGYHGFIYAVDDITKKGPTHSIRVTFAGTNVALLNSPKSITCESAVNDGLSSRAGFVGNSF